MKNVPEPNAKAINCHFQLLEVNSLDVFHCDKKVPVDVPANNKRLLGLSSI